MAKRRTSSFVPDEGWLFSPQASKFLHCSEAHLRALAGDGTVRRQKHSGSNFWEYNWSDLRKVLDTNPPVRAPRRSVSNGHGHGMPPKLRWLTEGMQAGYLTMEEFANAVLELATSRRE